MTAEAPLPLVAVIMPSLNHERFVTAAVESIFAQGYGNLRVVICDDASTDGNYAKLQELAARFPIILLKNEIRQGIVKTLNRCYAACAEAEYFYALASDDMIEPGMIKACIAEFIHWPKAGMLLGSYLNIDADGQPLSVARVRGSARQIKLRSPFERFLPSFQFHRGEFTRSAYPLNEAMMGEDMYLFSFCILSNFEVIQTDIPFIRRRLHGGNASQSQAYVTSTETEWKYLPDTPAKHRLERMAERRHMLCCLGLPNGDKERFITQFSRHGWSWHYMLFRFSFFAPFRWAARFSRWLVRATI
jgi:glycosyltransferase involved in cell wall biosynthesis